jgi:hypothetical protein
MSNSKPILYALECTHGAPGPSTLVSGALFCAWCRDDQKIVAVIEYEWRAKCHMCTFSRWAGLSKHNAEIFIKGHISRNSTHEGHIEYSRNPEAVRTAEKMHAWKGKAAS